MKAREKDAGGWRATLLLFAAAFALRLAVAAALGALGLVDDHRYDDGAYLDMARTFLGRDPRIFVTHPPLYSLLLAPFLAIPVVGLALARVAQLALGAAMAPLTARLSGTLGLSRRAALAAGWIVALHPVLLFFSARLMTETPFAFLTLAFFIVWLQAWRDGSLEGAAAAGVVGGLASLTRGTFMPMGGMLAVCALALRRRQPRWAALVACCGVAWALTIAPWTARNWVRTHRFVPISEQGGWSLWEGMTTDLDEIARRPVEMGNESRAHGFTEAADVNAYFAAKAKAWIRAHPREFAWLCVRKAAIFWRPAPYPPHPAKARWGIGVYESLLYALALLGLARGAGRAPAFLFLYGWALLLTVVHSVFASTFRYRMPLEPILAVLAGAALASLAAGFGVRANEVLSR